MYTYICTHTIICTHMYIHLYHKFTCVRICERLRQRLRWWRRGKQHSTFFCSNFLISPHCWQIFPLRCSTPLHKTFFLSLQQNTTWMHVWVCVSVYNLFLKQLQRKMQECYMPAKMYLQEQLVKQNFNVARFFQESRVRATNAVIFWQSFSVSRNKFFLVFLDVWL